jgi:hypothetical protein
MTSAAIARAPSEPKRAAEQLRDGDHRNDGPVTRSGPKLFQQVFITAYGAMTALVSRTLARGSTLSASTADVGSILTSCPVHADRT